MNENIPSLTYTGLDELKFGGKYQIPEDGNKVYYYSFTKDNLILLMRLEGGRGISTIIDKKKSKLAKALIGPWNEFEILPVDKRKVENFIKNLEEKK